MNLLTAALDLFFPPKCPFCRRVLKDPRAPLCSQCQPLLPWLEKKEAFRKVDHTSGCWSPLVYKDTVRECVHRYKFTPIPAYGKPLGLLVAQCVLDHPEITPDVVTWAPLSRKSLKKRGFDQARLLAEEVGRSLDLPVEPLLEKTRETQQQSLLETPSQRKANTLGAYRLRGGANVEGKKILLVDDVLTSGATLGACALALKQGGAGEVYCATLAQAGK